GKAGGAGTSGGGAGKGGGAGTISKGGAAGVAQGGSAGVISVGGSARACGGPTCGPGGIMCPIGSTPYVPPGACCPVCGPDCRLVDCPIKPCPPGTMRMNLPGQCCATSCTPVVTPDAGQTCDQ